MGNPDRAKEALERKKARDKRLAKIKSEENRTIKAALECFSTDSGKRVLLYLMRECGYQSPSTVLDPKTLEVKKESTVYNEARRDIYLRLRSMLKADPEILIDVEINQLKGEQI